MSRLMMMGVGPSGPGETYEFYSQRVFDLFPQLDVANAEWNGVSADASAIFGNAQRTSNSNNNDSISFTVVVPAGNYKLKFLYYQNTSSAIMEFRVDGALVDTLDQYGSLTYNLTWTSIQFSLTEGSHTITFRKNGKNASSSSYYLVCQQAQLIKQDAGSALAAAANIPHIIDVPVLLPSAHTNWNTLSMNTAFLFGIRLSSSGAQNDSISFEFWAPKGNFTLAFIHHSSTDRGIYGVTADGVAIGTVDGYSASGVNNVLSASLTGTFASTGIHTITFTMATKNASSSNYAGHLRHLQIRMTSITEPIAADLAPEVALLWPVFNEDTGQFTLTVNSGTAYYFYYGNASTQNDEITMSSNTVLRPGTYRLDVIGTRAANAGQLCLLDGGSNVGNADFYGASLGNHIASSAGFALAGFAPHTFKLKSATKNASSSGYFNRFTLARLIRTGS